MTAARSSPPRHPPGQESSAPGSAAPVRATRAIQPAGTAAQRASSSAAGIHTGAAPSAANPSTVAGPAANSASRLQGTATRLTRAASTATTGPHTACAAAAAASASASRGGTPRRCMASLHRGARVSRAPVASTDNRKPGLRASHGSYSTSSRTAAARAGSRDLRRPVAMASKVTIPQAAARSTLGSGRHTTTKARVSTAPQRAVVRRDSPSRGARPPRSASWARAGGPISRNSTTVRLDPDTASRCTRSVARKASSRSGGTREVSPTTSPGSSARASGGRPSVASRSPARKAPATRCVRSGPPIRCGGLSPGTRSNATGRPPPRAGVSRADTATRVEGSSRVHSGCRASTRTGVVTRVLRPSGPVSRVSTASSRTPGGPVLVRRGSAVTVSSASTAAYAAASPGTGPALASARARPATPAPAAAHSRAAAAAAPTVRRGPGRRHPASTSAPAPAAPSPTPTPVQRPGIPSASAAAAQAAPAGTTSRRSTGRAPSGRLTAAPGGAGRRTGAPRSR